MIKLKPVKTLALIPSEDASVDYKLGPAMKALKPQHRAFVWAVMELGTSRFGDAALTAGYQGTEQNLRALGYRLSHDVGIQAAFLEEARKRLCAHAGVASTVLTQIMENPAVEARDRLKAIDMLFNRIGMPEVREEKLTVVQTTDEREMIAKIRAVIKENGMSLAEARALLGDRANEVLDAEFTEVDPETAPEPAPDPEDDVLNG